MNNPTREAEWATFYEESLAKFTQEMGFTPSFEEFQQIVLESDYRLGED